MGYDMYRLGPDGKRLPADWPTIEDDGKGTYPNELIGEYDDRDELSDSNYFRLNMWGMSTVRTIALAGAGVITGQEAAAEIASSELSTKDMRGMLQHIASSFQIGHKQSVKAPWITPWTSNGMTASAKECQTFADHLNAGLDKLELDPINILEDESISYYREFVTYLKGSQFGMLVG
tara:strand:- start:15944 stop:16474 length:531 start_codon:yes stop_codon:yes gene_type:complete